MAKNKKAKTTAAERGIPFTERKAANIQKRCGLTDAHLRKWKRRGFIPERYKDKNYCPTPRTVTRKAKERGIPYTEKVARRIQEQHNTPDTTVRDWKSRGYIPARYKNKNYKKLQQLASAKDLRRFSRLIQLPLLVNKHMGIADYRIADFKKKEARMTSAELQIYFKNTKQVSQSLQAYIDKPTSGNLKRLRQNSRIQIKALVDNPALLDQLYKIPNLSAKAQQQLIRKCRQWLRRLK